MMIEMYQFEVMEAIAYYAQKKLGMTIVKPGAETVINLDVCEWKPHYKKHKNGKFVRNAKGHATLDEDANHYIRHKLEFGELDTLSICLWTEEQEDQEAP